MRALLVSFGVLALAAAACALVPGSEDDPAEPCKCDGAAPSSDAASGVDGGALPDAEGPPGSDVAVEPCDKAGSTQNAADASFAATFARHRYPGKTRGELSGLRVIGHYVGVSRATLQGETFEYGPASAYLNDGVAVVSCGIAGTPYFDSVTFILPPQ
jgi:hypothetical protein